MTRTYSVHPQKSWEKPVLKIEVPASGETQLDVDVAAFIALSFACEELKTSPDEFLKTYQLVDLTDLKTISHKKS